MKVHDNPIAEEARNAEQRGGGRRCRECGCTDSVACQPPCSWSEPDLCSACDDHLPIEYFLQRICEYRAMSSHRAAREVIELLGLDPRMPLRRYRELQAG